MIGLYVIFGIIALVGALVSNRLKSKFKKYGKVRLPQGMQGKDIAAKMLQESGIDDVTITSVKGELTDHYNPMKKTINLSSSVYNQSSIAAAAVAAHETGHAIQHAYSYPWLKLRSSLVPVVQVASQWVFFVILFGILLIQTFPSLLLIGIIMYASITLFSFLTLPVEIDASRRALAWLKSSNITDSQTQSKANDALKWAAYTYVVNALGSLATLLYLIFIFMGAED